MSRYRITESVGHRIEDVHSYEDLEIHHPSSNAKGLITGRSQDFEPRRAHQQVDGAFEEVRTQPDGRTLVKKDLILSHDGRGPVNVPAPIEGYVHYLHDRTAAVRIYDRPFGEPGARLLAQSLHMDPRSFHLKEGAHIAYGQPMGAMSDTGTPGVIHAHVEAEPDQFRRYIRDIDSGVITPERYPAMGVDARPPAHVPGANPVEAASKAHASMSGSVEEGTRGTRVRDLQTTLSRLGYRDTHGRALVADGDFGPNTRHAVEAFQRDHHLKVDGVVGPRTSKALQRAEHPLLTDASHPQHALFKQAREKVQLMEGERCISTGLHTDRLAGVVVVGAIKQGLTRIDRVELSEDGTRARAVQISPMGDIAGLNRVTDPVLTQHAVQQPLAASSEQSRHLAAEREHVRASGGQQQQAQLVQQQPEHRQPQQQASPQHAPHHPARAMAL